MPPNDAGAVVEQGLDYKQMVVKKLTYLLQVLVLHASIANRNEGGGYDAALVLIRLLLSRNKLFTAIVGGVTAIAIQRLNGGRPEEIKDLIVQPPGMLFQDPSL